MNQDGANDMVIACQGLGSNVGIIDGEDTPGAMVILQSLSTAGTFGTPAVYGATAGLLSLAVADLNGDGRPDVAMTGLYPAGYGDHSDPDAGSRQPRRAPARNAVHRLGPAGLHLHWRHE